MVAKPEKTYEYERRIKCQDVEDQGERQIMSASRASAQKEVSQDQEAAEKTQATASVKAAGKDQPGKVKSPSDVPKAEEVVASHEGHQENDPEISNDENVDRTKQKSCREKRYVSTGYGSSISKVVVFDFRSAFGIIRFRAPLSYRSHLE